MKINRSYLFLIAGLIWMIAGVNVVNIGVGESSLEDKMTLKFILFTLMVFITFSTFVFRNVIIAERERIDNIEEKAIRWWMFFSYKGFAVMVFMSTMGISIRHFEIAPPYVISFFYTGLGSALLIPAITFILYSVLQRGNK